MRQFFMPFLLTAIAFSSMGAYAQTVIFEDDFSSDSSGAYSHFYFPEEKNVLVDYHYDYGRILNGFGLEIPASPHTAGADTAALMVSCNILEAPDNINSFVGVYTDQVFGGDHQVIFDFYCNIMDSGAGTTNRMSVGVNHSGEKRVNTYSSGYDPAGGFTKEDLLDTDGYMFAMSFDEGDGGSFRDYQFTEGAPGIDDILLGVTPGDEAQEIAAVLPDYAPRWFALDVNEETGEPISLTGWQGAD
ncbi:MAG: hypothetical protein JXR73_09580, partial [Candidatus Omnitrophica bacterium]|nr:hypothetical protein [Candidatus Omnitrophota bacterium]